MGPKPNTWLLNNCIRQVNTLLLKRKYSTSLIRAHHTLTGFVLLSDVYVAMDKKLDARQYLLSLQQNYHADDDIEQMINERLEKLK